VGSKGDLLWGLPQASSEPPALVNRKGHASTNCAVVWTMPNACANNARLQRESSMRLCSHGSWPSFARCLLHARLLLLPLLWNWPKWVLSGHNKRKTSHAHFSAHQGQPSEMCPCAARLLPCFFSTSPLQPHGNIAQERRARAPKKQASEELLAPWDSYGTPGRKTNAAAGSAQNGGK